MKTCKNCLWNDKCASDERCEYYTPVYGEEYIAIKEYNQDLKEREEEYQELVEEQDS